SGLVERSVDGGAIADFLRTGYVAAPHSPFAKITALVPGTRLVVEGESARLAPFWEVAPFLTGPPLALDLETAARQVRHPPAGAARRGGGGAVAPWWAAGRGGCPSRAASPRGRPLRPPASAPAPA